MIHWAYSYLFRLKYVSKENEKKFINNTFYVTKSHS